MRIVFSGRTAALQARRAPPCLWYVESQPDACHAFHGCYCCVFRRRRDEEDCAEAIAEELGVSKRRALRALVAAGHIAQVRARAS